MSKTWIINFQNSSLYDRLSNNIKNDYNSKMNNNNNNNNTSIIDSVYKVDKSKYDRPNYAAILGGGCFSGCVSCIITSPTELIKCIVQDSTKEGTATIRQELKDCMRLYRNYGLIRGVYRGLGVTIARDIPAFAIYFSLYEYFSYTFDPSKQSTAVAFTGGFLAGAVSWSAVYPIDVIKTHFQLRKLKYDELPLHKAIVHHIKHKGVKSLYQGLVATQWVCYMLATTTRTPTEQDQVTILNKHTHT